MKKMRLWVDGLERGYIRYVFILCMLLIETTLSFWASSNLSIVLIPIGALLLAYVPGALCVDILFARNRIRGYERVILSLALSSVIILTIPYMMSIVGIPFLRLNVVLVLDTVIAILMLGVGLRSRFIGNIPSARIQKSSLITVLVCAGLFTVVVTVATLNLHKFQPSFYVTDEKGQLMNYPYQITQRKAYYVQLHILNPTSSELKGIVIPTVVSGHTVTHVQVIVGPKSTWTQRFQLPTNYLNPDEAVKFVLKVPAQLNITRTLWVRYSVVSPGPRD